VVEGDAVAHGFELLDGFGAGRKRRPLPPKKLEILGNSLFRKLTRIFHLSGELA
jgi:hypothetical protein